MADVVFNIRAKDEASGAVDSVSDSLRDLLKRGQDIEDGLRDLGNTTDAATDSLQAYDRELADATRMFRKFRDANERAEAAQKESNDQARVARRELDRQRRATRELARETKEAERATRRFRRAQGRLATNIRNNRTIFIALSGILGAGGSGFIGQLSGAARESELLGKAIGISSGALLANRLEYEKIGKTATDYRNCLLYTSPSPRDS